MTSITCAGWLFRGVAEGGEPAIHSPRPVVMDCRLAGEILPPE
jgi:hypothetical protein